MEEARKNYIFTKFPWLREVTNYLPITGGIDSIRFRRINEFLLKTVGHRNRTVGSLVDSDWGEIYFVIDEDGNVHPVPEEYEFQSLYPHERGRKDSGVNILEYIYFKDINPQMLQGIVMVDFCYDDTSGQDFVRYQDVTVYLPSEQVDINNLLQAKLKKAQIRVENEILNT